MNFKNSSKMVVFLMVGMLFACSPEKERPGQEIETKSNDAASMKTDTETQTKAISVKAAKPQNTAPGLKVFIDPNTGKFLKVPPAGYAKPEKNNSTLQTNQSQNTKDKDKIFVNSDGVMFSKPPKQ